MAITLFAFLVGVYIAIGMVVQKYDWRVRGLLLGLSFGVPSSFYILFFF